MLSVRSQSTGRVGVQAVSPKPALAGLGPERKRCNAQQPSPGPEVTRAPLKPPVMGLSELPLRRACPRLITPLSGRLLCCAAYFFVSAVSARCS